MFFPWKSVQYNTFPCLKKGSVYFGVKTVLGATTERKRLMAKKNCVKLHSDQKRQKGRMDAERAKTPNRMHVSFVSLVNFLWLFGKIRTDSLTKINSLATSTNVKLLDRITKNFSFVITRLFSILTNFQLFHLVCIDGPIGH